MLRATSSCKTRMLRYSRWYSSDQMCSSVAPRINWAWTRIRLPSRITDPSTMASTRSILAISGTESCVSLKRITDVREMTRTSGIPERRPIRASVIPSARYSCVGSPDRFFKGNTASDLMANCLVPLALPRFSTKMTVKSVSTVATPNSTLRRIETTRFLADRTTGPEAT